MRHYSALVLLALLAVVFTVAAADPPTVIDPGDIEELPDVPGIGPKLRPIGNRAVPAEKLDENAGEAVNGLKLTMSADPAAMEAKDVQLRRALADTPRFTIEPTKLTLTFTNVSDKPIKLDLYAVTAYDKLKLHAVGPQPDSVRVDRLNINYLLASPTPADYPTIEPGKSLELGFQPQFPGMLGQLKFTLLHKGKYTAHAIYANPQIRANDKFGQGSWAGRVTSNGVELTVGQPAGPATQPASQPEYNHVIYPWPG